MKPWMSNIPLWMKLITFFILGMVACMVLAEQQPDEGSQARWCATLARDAGKSLEYLHAYPEFVAGGLDEEYYVWLMTTLRGWKGTREELEKMVFDKCNGKPI